MTQTSPSHTPAHLSAAVLSIGDELTLGQKLDTNSQWISRELVARGVPVREHATIADDLEQSIATMERLTRAHPLVIVTGGLGPTADDLTRQALAALLREELVEDESALAHLRAFMERRRRPLADNQRVQALRPRSAFMIDNPNGTAPGLHALVPTSAGGSDLFCLPGPPGELRPMFNAAIAPRLRVPQGREVITRVLHCLGIGEGDLAARLGPLMRRDARPLVGTTASGGVVSIRIRAEGDSASATRNADAAELECRRLAAPYLFGHADQTIQSVVLGALATRGQCLVVAESCTGGGLGALLTGVPGSSRAFLGGWIPYDNAFKSASLGVDPALIELHGAVSAPVALAMARGALDRAPRHTSGRASLALAITGVAGPDGGTADKPVGTVFIALAHASQDHHPGAAPARAARFRISGDRADIRDRAAKLALMMLHLHLAGVPDAPLLWQVTLPTISPSP